MDGNGDLSLVKILFGLAVFCSVKSALTKGFTRTASLVDFDLSTCMSPIKNNRSYFGEAASQAQLEAAGFLVLVKMFPDIWTSRYEIFSNDTVLLC